MKKLLIIILVFNSFIATHFMLGQNYVSKIENYESFNALKGKPLSDKFSNIESVKVVYDIDAKKIFFFNSSKIKLHFDFVNDYLGYDKGLTQFNEDNYSANDQKRDYLLGNLNHIKGTEKWIFELAASDRMSITMTEFLVKKVMQTSFIGNKLKFYLNNHEKIESSKKKLYKIDTVTSNYIFDEVQFQEVVGGSAIGILKKYTTRDLKTICPQENEIIILDETPNYLPNVRGLIVSELQTPLSHLVILGRNRKIPIMAFKKATTNSSISNLLNQNVKLDVSNDSFKIIKTAEKQCKKLKIKIKKLTIDSTLQTIVDLEKTTKNNVNAIGSKAQNMAFLISISKNQNFKTPENAFAIPFYFYKKHIGTKEINGLISDLLLLNTKTKTAAINIKLAQIRKQIVEKQIDTLLIASIYEKLKNQKEFKNFRFRSSTNAEDIDGFNGAGLYESKTGILNDSVKTFEKAIKNVWASTWSEAAFWERDLFQIDQRNVAMGVLVHRSFPDEECNGVVISTNIIRDDYAGITVNIQKGENAVVNPKRNDICEQFTIYDFENENNNQDIDVDYASHSNLNNNEPLLNIAEINTLYRTTKYIETKMHNIWRISKPIDLELKYIGKSRQLYIKQVRIFNK